MNPDDIALNFNPGTLVILNAVLGLIMFGIALDTTVDDFKVVLRKPKPFVIAILAQLIVLPAVTFGLTLILPVTPSMALGMILVACCPPGNVSNILTHRAGGDVALSVSMTAISNLLTIVMLPVNFAFWAGLSPAGEPLLQDVDLDPVKTFLEIALVIGLPFVAGVTINRLWPGVAHRAHKVVGPISFVLLLVIIVLAFIGNWEIFTTYITLVLLAVFLQHAMALGLGYGVARGTGLPSRIRKAMTFEVSVRNTGLGLVLVFAYFGGLGGMALVIAGGLLVAMLRS